MKKICILLLSAILFACGTETADTCLFETEGICFKESNTSEEIVSDLTSDLVSAAIEFMPEIFSGLREKMERSDISMFIQPERPECGGSTTAEGCTWSYGRIDKYDVYVYHEGDDKDCVAFSAYGHELIHVMVGVVNMPDNGDDHGHEDIWGNPEEGGTLEEYFFDGLWDFCEQHSKE